jgi:hypothetical protein
MANRLRLLSSKLTRAQRRVYRSVILFFLFIFLAMIWPVYPNFSRIRPLVAGLPFSMFYQVVLLFMTFVALVSLYRWESRRGDLD